MNKQDNINQLTGHLFRENSGKMVAVLSRMFGLSQIDSVMDVVQDTFETALSKWRFSGIPDNPSAWLMQVAKNKAINVFKRESKTEALSPSLYLNSFETGFETQFDILLSAKEVKDSQLRLLFTCCHPRFSARNQIIITLHILCGFGLPEIANALCMNEEAVKKALTRGKAILKKLDNILQRPLNTQTNTDIKTARIILYLMFNEGYKTTRSNEAINKDLCFEAIRLTKLLEDNTEDEKAETAALLSLMFFNLSRFPARLSHEGEWLTLEEQERSLWNKVFIEEGFYYLKQATCSELLSTLHIEAIIASLHCSAPSFEETDWNKIAVLYRQLEILKPSSPLITLNRIIAESYLSHKNSIQLLDEIGSHALLKNNFLLSAAKGDIYKRKGEMIKAQDAFEQAFELALSPVDKKFLRTKIIQCQHSKN